MTRQLVIIPGLGDNRAGLYALLRPLWRLYGFKVHVYTYGWETSQSFATLQQQLMAYLEASSPGKVYILGISAGGTAAVNALSERPRIVRVVTICSPYHTSSFPRNRLLEQSLADTDVNIQRMKKPSLAKILSLYAYRDGVVSAVQSQAPGVKSKRVWSCGHALTIALCLTLYSPVIRRFLVRH